MHYANAISIAGSSVEGSHWKPCTGGGINVPKLKINEITQGSNRQMGVPWFRHCLEQKSSSQWAQHVRAYCDGARPSNSPSPTVAVQILPQNCMLAYHTDVQLISDHFQGNATSAHYKLETATNVSIGIWHYGAPLQSTFLDTFAPLPKVLHPPLHNICPAGTMQRFMNFWAVLFDFRSVNVNHLLFQKTVFPFYRTSTWCKNCVHKKNIPN